jgi:hypothetical protein
VRDERVAGRPHVLFDFEIFVNHRLPPVRLCARWTVSDHHGRAGSRRHDVGHDHSAQLVRRAELAPTARVPSRRDPCPVFSSVASRRTSWRARRRRRSRPLPRPAHHYSGRSPTRSMRRSTAPGAACSCPPAHDRVQVRPFDARQQRMVGDPTTIDLAVFREHSVPSVDVQRFGRCIHGRLDARRQLVHASVNKYRLCRCVRSPVAAKMC